MTFEQLYAFIEAVERDTFFDAAEELHITQSALSKQIMKLEKELELPLLDRSRRSARVTEAGSIFYEEAKKLISQYQECQQKMEEVRRKDKGRIRIGTLPILAQYHLNGRIRLFSEQNPDVEVIIEELEEPELVRGMEKELYDCVITRKNMGDLSGYRSYLLAEDKLVGVFPSDHPTAVLFGKAGKPVPLSAFAGEPLILMNSYTAVHQRCIELFHKANVSVHVAWTARAETILGTVAMKEGVSLLPKTNLNLFRYEGVTVVPLEAEADFPVILAIPKEKSSVQAVRRFLHALSAFAPVQAPTSVS